MIQSIRPKASSYRRSLHAEAKRLASDIPDDKRSYLQGLVMQYQSAPCPDTKRIVLDKLWAGVMSWVLTIPKSKPQLLYYPDLEENLSDYFLILQTAAETYDTTKTVSVLWWFAWRISSWAGYMRRTDANRLRRHENYGESLISPFQSRCPWEVLEAKMKGWERSKSPAERMAYQYWKACTTDTTRNHLTLAMLAEIPWEIKDKVRAEARNLITDSINDDLAPLDWNEL